ncbi:MAG: hypothetical protein AAGK32_16280 [Actinomycetota bacterium]
MRRLTMILAILALLAGACGDGEVDQGVAEPEPVETSAPAPTTTAAPPAPTEVGLGAPAPSAQVDSAQRLFGEAVEPAELGEVGLADTSATAYVTDGLVVASINPELAAASGCIGVTVITAEPSTLVSGPDCPLDQLGGGVTVGAAEAEYSLWNADGTVAALPSAVPESADTVIVFFPVQQGDTVVLLTADIPLFEGPAPGVTEVPVDVELGDEIVLVAPDTPFDGVGLTVVC